MDLNEVLKLWPFAAVIVGVPAIFYAKGLFTWAKGKLGITSSESPVAVGTLAENLKAIRLHCTTVGDQAAMDACDKIAPALFHEKETGKGTPTT